DGNRAVDVLVVFGHGDERAADGEAGPVQGVDEVGLASALRLVADVGTTPAEVGVRRARRDLAVLVLPRQPHLDVVAFRRAEADVAGTSLDPAVRQPQALRR